MSRRQQRKGRALKAAAGAPPAPLPARSWRGRDWLVALALTMATAAVYLGVRHAGFIWDDDSHVIRPELASLHGLLRIWSEPGATQQYYPVLYSAFWLELRLFGYSALGYHLANVALHAAAACLLYAVLRRLSVPGAPLAAAAFALHPVCVESVAWISEQKNTLSAVFYLAAALVYLGFDERRRIRTHALATLLFGLALLSKSVTATLPAALLAVFWWKRGGLAWRRDVVPLCPWLAMGAAAGAVTTWMETTRVGATGAEFVLGPADRFIVAGRAIWFYLGKLFWPADLVFIYPRWTIDPHSPWQVLCPVAVVAVLAALFALRRRSRGPLAAALLFAGTLFPALGFINVYPFRYSYVADHFQYLAAAMMLSAVAAALATGAARLPPAGRAIAAAAAVCAVAALSSLTWRQCAIYADIETLWRATIDRNPGSWIAHDNLGVALLETGRTDEAVSQFRKAEDIDPGDLETHNNLGIALRREGRMDEAIAEYRIALGIRPDDLNTNFNLGNALLQAGRVEEAMARYEKSLEISPGFADAHNNLGNALRRIGRLGDAIAEYRKAVADDPANGRARANLESALAESGNL
jgi:tetratricopeptide (TPR) repeat protein